MSSSVPYNRLMINKYIMLDKHYDEVFYVRPYIGNTFTSPHVAIEQMEQALNVWSEVA